MRTFFFKKFLTVVLVLAMAVPFNYSLFAAETGQKDKKAEMQEKALDIASKYFSFNSGNYSFSYYEQEDRRIVYTFSKKDDPNGESVVISTDSGGNLVSFNTKAYTFYPYNNDTVYFSAFTKDEVTEKAKTFLTKVYGENANCYKPQYTYSHYSSPTADVKFTLEIDGYPVSGATCLVGVDKKTGEIATFYCYDYSINDILIEDKPTDSVLGQSYAEKYFIEASGFGLSYNRREPYREGVTETLYPVYSMSRYNVYIDAYTGEATLPFSLTQSRINCWNSAHYSKADQHTGYYSAGSGFDYEYRDNADPSELGKFESYMTKDEAVEMLLKTFDLKEADVKDFLSRVFLNKSDFRQYIWVINYFNPEKKLFYYGEVDALAKNLLCASKNSTDVENTLLTEQEYQKLLSFDEAHAKARSQFEAMVTCSYGDKISFSNSDISELYRGVLCPAYTFYFPMTFDGATFDGGGAYVYFDNVLGEITYCVITPAFNVAFEKPSGNTSPEKAFRTLTNYPGQEFELLYVPAGIENGKYSLKLVYAFINSSGNYVLDEKTGEVVDRWGDKPVLAPELTVTDYSAAKGHWSEKIVTILADNDVAIYGDYSFGETFKPDEPAKQGTLMTLLQNYADIKSMSNSGGILSSRINTALIDYNDKNSDWDKTIKIKDALKLTCDIMGYGELAQKQALFNFPFKDIEIAGEYKGYIAIADAYGMIHHESFNPENEVTNAQCMLIVYSLLKTMEK